MDQLVIVRQMFLVEFHHWVDPEAVMFVREVSNLVITVNHAYWLKSTKVALAIPQGEISVQIQLIVSKYVELKICSLMEQVVMDVMNVENV